MDNVLCKEAGVRIKMIRTTKGMTRDKLAEKVGISGKFLYEIEQGKKRFSAEVLCSIAKALDVSCDYIMFGKLLECDDETGIADVISLFDRNQKQKLVPILQALYEMLE